MTQMTKRGFLNRLKTSIISQCSMISFGEHCVAGKSHKKKTFFSDAFGQVSSALCTIYLFVSFYICLFLLYCSGPSVQECLRRGRDPVLCWVGDGAQMGFVLK